MNLLALDLGTHTGYCYNDGDDFYCGTWKLATPKQIKEQRKTRLDRRGDRRILGLHGAISLVLKTHRIDAIVFEDVQFASSVMQVQLWSSLRAAVWLASGGIFVDCIPVGTLKKFAGHGAASKAQMSEFLKKKHPKYWKEEYGEDAIDAAWVWLWGQQNIGKNSTL